MGEGALAPIWAEALARWGRVPALTGQKLKLTINNLPGTLLAQAVGDTIMVDADAAGYGWFIDPTPVDDAEFVPGDLAGEMVASEASPAFGRMDLLTAVMHEVCHVLGLEHQPQGVMEATLPAGERHVPLASPKNGRGAPATVSQGGSAQIAANCRSPQEKLFLLFDEKKGEFFRPAHNASLMKIDDLRFDPAQWEEAGVSSKDNSEDWIFRFSPKRLHG